jgi:lipoic acid synthetase
MTQPRTDPESRGAFKRLPRLPAHCRATDGRTPAVERMQRLLRRAGLHSVCEEARCPNRPGCFARGTVTFMLLGDTCTRACRFCSVATGRPAPVDPDEPRRVAEAVAALGLAHVVLTSVNRDDLPDQGAGQFAYAIEAIRRHATAVTVEVLTPDFRGDPFCIDRVAAARPEVYNHNVETVPRLYRQVRPGALYRRSLDLLGRVKARHPGIVTKSGLMLGLGEERDEVIEVLAALRAVGTDAVTLGQYLRPSLRQLPVDRYLEPGEFEEYREHAARLGFRYVASGPLVRSSFHADVLVSDLLHAGEA